MKKFLTYLLAAGLLIGVAMVIYTYQEYMGEDIDPSLETNTNPLTNKSLNAVVTSKSSTRAGVNVAYADIDTKEVSTFTLNDRYQNSIGIGDTLTKDKGEKLLLVYKKEGKIETVPID